MGFHCDQSQDLEENTLICILSFYLNPTAQGKRAFVYKQKNDDVENTIIMEHNSMLIFDTQVNMYHLHKIVLTESKNNEWVGLTFRTSKTFVQFTHVDKIEQPIPTINNQPLRFVTDEKEKKEYFFLKGLENKQADFTWPILTYTISPSNLMRPIVLE